MVALVVVAAVAVVLVAAVVLMVVVVVTALVMGVVAVVAAAVVVKPYDYRNSVPVHANRPILRQLHLLLTLTTHFVITHENTMSALRGFYAA